MLELLAAAAAELPIGEMEDAVFIQTQLQRVREFRGKAAAVISELWVDPEGRVQSCKVIQYTGTQAVADRVCSLIKQRQLTTPKGFSGEPTHAFTRMTTGWASTSSGSGTLVQDLLRLAPADRVMESATPEGARNGKINLLVAVDESGRARNCRSLDPKLSESLAPYCGQVKNEQFTVLKDEAGQSVPYLRPYSIAFLPD